MSKGISVFETAPTNFLGSRATGEGDGPQCSRSPGVVPKPAGKGNGMTNGNYIIWGSDEENAEEGGHEEDADGRIRWQNGGE